MNSSGVLRTQTPAPTPAPTQARLSACQCDCESTELLGGLHIPDCVTVSSCGEPSASFSSMYERSTLSRTHDSFVNATENEAFSRIEQRYGDLRHLHVAANVIQKAYRQHVLNKSFLDLRNRRRTQNDLQEPDGTMTLTPQRASDSHGTLKPDGVQYSRNNNVSSEQACADCSKGRPSGSRMVQPNDESNGDRSPVWLRKTPAQNGQPNGSHANEPAISSRVVLRTSRWIEDARSNEPCAESKIRADRERRPLSFGAPASISSDCNCEQCRVAHQVAQLGIVFANETQTRPVSSQPLTHHAPIASREGNLLIPRLPSLFSTFLLSFFLKYRLDFHRYVDSGRVSRLKF